jgi:hypothetical protein
MPPGPPLIYLLKNCCLLFTGLFDGSYFLGAGELEASERSE